MRCSSPKGPANCSSSMSVGSFMLAASGIVFCRCVGLEMCQEVNSLDDCFRKLGPDRNGKLLHGKAGQGLGRLDSDETGM